MHRLGTPLSPPLRKELGSDIPFYLDTRDGMSEPYYQDSWLTVYGGDCREVMRELEPESVHCVVTSPPYWGLRDYGNAGQLGLEATPEEYVANLVDVFREVRRVLRADGTVWLNLGDTYAGSGKGGNPEGSPWKGFVGNARREEAITKTAGEVRVPAGLKPKDLVGIPWRVAFALQKDGWYLRSDIIWAKPNPMPESVTDRPTKSHEYLFLLSKSARYYYDADAVREAAETADRTGPRRSYMPGSASSMNGGEHQEMQGPFAGLPLNPAGRNLRSVWTITTQPYPGAHYAVFPEALPERCIKAGVPELGTVLDPFAGSGTVGRVAQRLSRRAILIDLNPDYLAQAMNRNRDIPLGLGAA